MLLRRCAGILILAVLAIACIGCANRSVSKGSNSALKIGFIVKQPEEVWFQNEWKFAQMCADKDGFNLIKIGAGDGEKVLSAIDNLASQGAKGFVICTPDVRLGPAIVARAKANDMKVFAVDDQFLGADGKPMKDVPYMGISARNIGEKVGNALYAEFKKRKWTAGDTAVCIITFDELPTCRERTDGATAALVAAGFPASKIYRGAEKITGVPAAIDAANIVLTQHRNVKHWLICSVNDEGVMGAVRAMEGMGFKSTDMVGIGIGGSTCLTEFGKPTATGFWGTCLISPRRHGYETTEQMYKWIHDDKQPSMQTLTAGTIVNRASYKAVMKQEGLLD